MKLTALCTLMLAAPAVTQVWALKTAGRDASNLTANASIGQEARTLDARARSKNETAPHWSTSTQMCSFMNKLGDWDKVQQVCAWDLGAAGSNVFFLFRDKTIVHECGCRNKLQEYVPANSGWKYWHSETDVVSCTGPPEFWYGPDWIFGPYLMSCKPRVKTFDSRTQVSTYF